MSSVVWQEMANGRGVGVAQAIWLYSVLWHVWKTPRPSKSFAASETSSGRDPVDTESLPPAPWIGTMRGQLGGQWLYL